MFKLYKKSDDSEVNFTTEEGRRKTLESFPDKYYSANGNIPENKTEPIVEEITDLIIEDVKEEEIPDLADEE
jgi:hypothetical protein